MNIKSQSRSARVSKGLDYECNAVGDRISSQDLKNKHVNNVPKQ